MAATNSKCERCIFWHNQNIIGMCKRYPQVVNKHSSDWCGEFMTKVEEVQKEPQKRKYTRRQDVESVA